MTGEKDSKTRFNGEKIKEARELRRMDITELSYRTGISRQSISNYENGGYTPKPDNMSLLSDVLKVKWSFFTQPSKSTDEPIYFRSLSAATKIARVSAMRTLDMMEEIVGAIQNFTDLPKLNIPEFDIKNPELLTHDQIEECAMACRKLWELGLEPIEDLIAEMESAGILVYTSEIDSDSLDAFSRWGNDGKPYVHLCSNKHCAVRTRFDAAHELGHILLHKNVKKSDLRYQKYFKDFEEQANYFASVFLMPEKTFLNDITRVTLSHLLRLKPKWRVSVGAMIKRCAHLELIDSEGEKYLWISRRKKWGKTEPLDNDLETIPQEEPLWIKEAIKIMIEEQYGTASEILSYLHYDNDLIAQFLNLDILRANVERGDTSDLIRRNIRESIKGGAHSNIIKFKVA